MRTLRTGGAQNETLRCSPLLLIALGLFFVRDRSSELCKHESWLRETSDRDWNKELRTINWSWGASRAARCSTAELGLIPAPISHLETTAVGKGSRGLGTPTARTVPESGSRGVHQPAPGVIYQPAGGRGHGCSTRAWMARMAMRRGSCPRRATGCWLDPYRLISPLTCWEVRPLDRNPPPNKQTKQKQNKTTPVSHE